MYIHEVRGVRLFRGEPAQGKGAACQVEHAGRNDQQRTGLAAQEVGREAHQGRDDGAAADPRDHQPRNLVGFFRMAFQRRRVDHREDARAGEADRSDERQHSHGALHEVEDGHGGDGREDVDAEITHVVHAHQQDRTDQRTDRAADEVNARPESGLLDGVTAAFDQQLGRHGIHPHVDADDKDDPEEEEEHRAVFQQGERCTDGRGLRRFGLFADGGAHEPCGREQRDEREDREEVLPVAQRAGGECGDEGAAERRDRLDDLACGQRTGQRVPLDHVGEQRVERHLEDRIADAQQHECRHARGKVVVYERDQHTDGRDAVADLYHVLAAEAVHGEGRRNRKQQEPDENHRGDESGEGLAEPEILLDIAGRDTDHVAEAHDEETEQDGQ